MIQRIFAEMNLALMKLVSLVLHVALVLSSVSMNYEIIVSLIVGYSVGEILSIALTPFTKSRRSNKFARQSSREDGRMGRTPEMTFQHFSVIGKSGMNPNHGWPKPKSPEAHYIQDYAPRLRSPTHYIQVGAFQPRLESGVQDVSMVEDNYYELNVTAKSTDEDIYDNPY